jgi:signal transduction histidine kinase
MPKIFSMEASIEFIFFLCLFISGFISVLSFMSYRLHQEKEFAHLTEFWSALVVNSVMTYVFHKFYPQGLAVIMLGWIWPLRSFRLLLEDFTGSALFHRYVYFIPFGGAFLTSVLITTGQPFYWYTLPFSTSVAMVGMGMVLEAKRRMPKKDRSVLHGTFFIFSAFFFLSRLAFPYLGLIPQSPRLHLFSELLLIVGFSGCGLSVFMEMLKHRHSEEMNSVLKERNDKLLGQSKYSELGMMSAGIAHEINNPLAVIQARTTQLLRIYRDPHRQKDLADGLQQILFTSERINRTIQGVREFVHQDEKAPMLEINLKDLVDDVLAFCGQRLKNHGVSLRFYNLDRFTVFGNKIQLEQIILNLINNSFDAIEYLPDKWIEMTVEENPDQVMIFLKDSGLGIPSEIASRMMEPFFSTKDLGKGTGLGLALAKGIAEKHGGTLKYLPKEKHTTFVLELPRELETEWGVSYH